MHRGIQRCTKVYTIQRHTEVSRGTQGCIEVHRGVQGCTERYTEVHRDTEIYRGREVKGLTLPHITSSESYARLYNKTNKS